MNVPGRRASDDPVARPMRLAKRELSLATSVVLFALVVTTAIFGVFASNALHSRSVAENEARNNAVNLAQSLAQQSADTFEAVDGVLLAIAARVESAGAERDERAALQELMAAIMLRMPRLHGLFVVDEYGRLTASNASAATRPDLPFDREPYFRYHRMHSGTSVRISGPVRSKTEDTVVIEVSRRLEHANGEFAGVAVAQIALGYFQRSFDAVDVGRSGAIALIDDDQTIDVRRPSAAIGRKVGGFGMFSGDLAYQQAGTFVQPSPVDHVLRLAAFRRLDSYPLLVVVSLAQSDYLAEWRADTRANVIALALMVAMIAGLAYGLAGQFARRQRAEESLAQMALADGLTGLPNRREFDTVLEREWRTAVRDAIPLALLMVDVDSFKAYNDRYGHLLGDDVLIAIAASIRGGVVRPRDLAARYGGEEFAVILPSTDTSSALVVAERVRAAVTALAIPNAGSTHGIVSVSIGAASVLPYPSDNRTQLIAAADRALYAAKDAGRNRSMAAPPGAADLAAGMSRVSRQILS